MPVRVIIQRWVRYGREAELRAALEQMRLEALNQPGYISGETLRCPSDPSLWVVISSWETLADWQRWAQWWRRPRRSWSWSPSPWTTRLAPVWT
ncbi:MAG: antibiotic biosynthesis monooxygenase [candidate division NC10 bacterium]|nr:antibiotic biosynthesis monooxygenase [candidate division NC10 bacterium]